MPSNYLIPQELTSIRPNGLLMQSTPIDPKMIYLEPNEEKFFVNFPSAWKQTLDDALGNIYESGDSRFIFSIAIYDGNNIQSYRLTMFGIEFKTYLAGLLKMAKTVALYVFNGLQVSRFIICRP